MAQEGVPLQLTGLSGNFLPRNVVGPIFDQAQEQSVVLRFGQSIPVGFGDTAIPTVTRRPEVGVVGLQGFSGEDTPDGSEYYGEGKRKPVSSYAYGVETIRPIKLSTIVVTSEEFSRTNPEGWYQQISGDLASAVARGIDLAVMYGLSANNGTQIPGVKFLNQTDNSVAIGTTAAADGGMAGDIAALAGAIGNAGPGYDINGFAADPRLRFQVMSAVDQFGRPIFQPGQTPSLTNQVDSLMGIPVVYGRSVSGRVGANPDTGVRAFAGDWQGQLRYGYALDMTIKASNEASVKDNDGTDLNLWQNNLQALLVETVFGWAIGDVDAFGNLTAQTAPAGGGEAA